MSGFLKRGAESKNLAQAEQAQAESRKAEQGKPWRFFVKQGESTTITFVDGELDHEGYLVPPRLYEHNLKIAGKWGNLFVCPAQSEPEAGHRCPICESGARPTLYAAFTIVDHTETKSKDGTKTYKDQTRMLMATPTTYEMLHKIAQKRGGLAGATFEVSRSTKDKSPAAGDFYDFETKRTPEKLKGMWVNRYEKDGKPVEEDQFTVIDYDNAFNYHSPDELRAMPIFGGNPNSTPSAPETSVAPTTPVDYDSAL